MKRSGGSAPSSRNSSSPKKASSNGDEDGGKHKYDRYRQKQIEKRRTVFLGLVLLASCFFVITTINSPKNREERMERLNRMNAARGGRRRTIGGLRMPGGGGNSGINNNGNNGDGSSTDRIPLPNKNVGVGGGGDGTTGTDGTSITSLPHPYHQRYQPSHLTTTYQQSLTSQVQRWVDPRHLPKLPDYVGLDPIRLALRQVKERGGINHKRKDFQKESAGDIQPWETYIGEETVGADDIAADDGSNHLYGDGSSNNGGNGVGGPLVDYTKHTYTYPDFLPNPINLYPYLKPLGQILKEWPQDDIDHPPQPFVESLMRFDYSDKEQRSAALRYRQREVPFKVYNVPEIDEAGRKWNDEYIGKNFDSNSMSLVGNLPSKGTCQESKNNYFAFFQAKQWDVPTMGKPPTLDTDWSYALWSKHARYADKVGLAPDAPHYYWQAGVPQDERYKDKKEWTFVSKDLPSFSSTESNFFQFKPDQQKGIQCRFGERGVTAATHYDAGRNMVAMITGAKRYILAPPKACSKLGIVTARRHPSFRHSMLNFAHMNFVTDEGLSETAKYMPEEERAWLEIAKDSMAIDTVLKAGEVLYIPSHWFHYITSLQKSAQCNVRSGRDEVGTERFGGFEDVEECMGEDAG